MKRRVKPGPKLTERRNWEAYQALKPRPDESVKERIIRFCEVLAKQGHLLGESAGKRAYYEGKRLHDAGLEPPEPPKRSKNPRGRPWAFYIGDVVGQFFVYSSVRAKLAKGDSLNEACRIVCQHLNYDPGFWGRASYLKEDQNHKPLSVSTVRNLYLDLHAHFTKVSRKGRKIRYLPI